MKIKNYIIFTLIVFLATGCFKEYQSHQINISKKNIEKETKKIYEMINKRVKLEKDDFVYTHLDLPDPFQSIFDKRSASDTTPIMTPDIRNLGKVKELSELQRFEIDELKLLGVVYGTTPRERRALLKDPSGKTHVVRERELVGKNFGRVTSIKKDHIIISEETYEITGKKIVKKIPIKLEEKIEK